MCFARRELGKKLVITSVRGLSSEWKNFLRGNFKMGKKRLLVVDDEPQIGDMLSEALTDRFDVLTARTGEEAIKKAILNHPSCILMDVMMPEMGGFILCEILKSLRQTQLIPILLVSAKPRHEVWDMAQEMGVFDYIEKPFSIENLAKVIDRALREAPIERRKTPRVRIKIPIVVRGKDGLEREFEAWSDTEDVSQFGALVRLPMRVPVGSQVEVRQAYFPGQDKDSIVTTARVIWNDEEEAVGPYRHGLEFLSPSSHWVIKQ